MIAHNKPTIGNEESDILLQVLDSKWIAPGQKVEAFEKALSNYISKNGETVATDSGTSALHLALLSLGIKNGDEVILPTYVCSAVLNALNYVGAIPILVDINSYDFNISYTDTVDKLNDRTKAIIIPHMYGIPADIDKFLDLNIPIIEDCAQSIGGKYKGKNIGTFGDVSVFSFYATKLLTTAKGGAVYSKNRELISIIRDLVDFDCRPTYKTRYNYHLTDLQASLGLVQLQKLDGFIERRNDIAKEYNKTINRKNDACVLAIPDFKNSVYYRYVIISNQNSKNIKDAFLRESISVINPLEDWELLHNYLHLNSDSFKNAMNIVQKTISVPIYPSLSDEEVTKVGNAIAIIYD
ncbi:DegT/DnrJ/EryC1/StrS aminotransferase family protein [Methanococcoides sp. SA1]|nr:DegT/DnrJ/EryC1/StrS aminotransferase family protein [Methanococcoides sp. SA1]